MKPRSLTYSLSLPAAACLGVGVGAAHGGPPVLAYVFLGIGGLLLGLRVGRDVRWPK